MARTPQYERRTEDLSRWKFSRTISLDSVIVLVVTVVSGLVFLLSMDSKIDKQDMKTENMQKLVERIEADQKERMTRLELANTERNQRLEQAIKEQGLLIQNVLTPKLQR